MPRKLILTEKQVAFIMANKSMGGTWLAKELQVDQAALYQWGTNNKISLKRDKSLNKKRSLKTMCSKWPKGYKRYKAFIVERDGLRCHYCDSMMKYDEAQIDHKVPRVRGGTDAPHNLVLACARCNNIKGSSCYDCSEFRDAIKQKA
jgi:hypothetical protein